MVGKTLYIIWYASLGQGLSGGDNILIELTKRWADKLNITIYTGIEGLRASRQKNLSIQHLQVCPSKTKFKYLERLYRAIKLSFKPTPDIVYTSSDFIHDLVVGLIMKLRNPKMLWIAGYYLIICPPFARRSPYKGLLRFKGMGYWLIQQLTLQIVRNLADVVYITSEPDRKYFKNKVVVIRGGVTIPKFKQEKTVWDIVFMGRFHYQKGIRELKEILTLIRKKRYHTNLLVIGDGPLRDEIPFFENHIPHATDSMKDGFFRRCKVIVHPATYDSGGMSAAEGMAYGLPAVGFDLPAYKTYYPRGMIKVKTTQEFADEILKLLTDKEYYQKWSKEAREFIDEEWNWDRRAEEIYMQSFG